MPTYEYQCDKCGEHFEYFQSIKDAPKTECEACGGSLTKLLSAGSGLIFKGSGFYITDYKSNGGGKSEGSSGSSDAGSSAKAESAPAAKSEGSKPAPAPAAKSES